MSTSGDTMSTSGDTMSTSGGYHEYIGGYHEFSKTKNVIDVIWSRIATDIFNQFN